MADRNPQQDNESGAYGTRTFTEELEVAGSQLMERTRDLVQQGNIRRLIIRYPDGGTLLEIPLTVGAVAAGALLFFNPMLAGLGAIGALLGRVRIEVIREVPAGEPVTEVDFDSAPVMDRVEVVAEDVRQRLEPVVDDLRQRAEPAIQDARRQVDATADDVRVRVEDAVSNARVSVGQAAEDVRARVGDAAEDVRTRVEDAASRVRSAGDNLESDVSNVVADIDDDLDMDVNSVPASPLDDVIVTTDDATTQVRLDDVGDARIRLEDEEE